MQCLSLSGLRWAKKTGIFKLGTLTIMTVTYWNRQIINRFLAFYPFLPFLQERKRTVDSLGDDTKRVKKSNNYPKTTFIPYTYNYTYTSIV